MSKTVPILGFPIIYFSFKHFIVAAHCKYSSHKIDRLTQQTGGAPFIYFSALPLQKQYGRHILTHEREQKDKLVNIRETHRLFRMK